MVLLTMTPSIVEALETLGDSGSPEIHETNHTKNKADSGPTLEAPALGKPISHGQILDLWQSLRDAEKTEYTLEKLLRGAQVYVPPPPPKPEPTPEYVALMARLRREEEARAYDRMLNPAGPNTAFPTSSPFPSFDPFAAVHKPESPDNDDADDGFAIVTKQVSQQLMVVLNFLVSIFGTAAAVWFAARWWSVTARVLLSLAAAILVAIADVAIFSGFAWRIAEGKSGKGKEVEVREVLNTWVIGGEGPVEEEEEGEIKAVGKASGEETTKVRRRNRPPS